MAIRNQKACVDNGTLAETGVTMANRACLDGHSFLLSGPAQEILLGMHTLDINQTWHTQGSQRLLALGSETVICPLCVVFQ